ncbi:tetrahydrofolate synthase [Segatella salivae]|nr:tetrahydrofolate synthase [Segatella salivae]
MNVFNIVIALMMQRRRFGANISMDVFAIANVFNPQYCLYCDDYSMNVFNIVTGLMVQRRRFGANISMDVFAIENVTTMQRRRFYAGIPMNVSSIMYALMVQRRRCCSFDSPGLARNEPTPGKHRQGDSTP